MNLTLRVKSAPTIKLRYVPGLKGDKGDKGDTATIAVGDTATGAPGTDAAVINSGTPGAAIFNFTIPRGDTGDAATIAVGSVSASAPGSTPTVANVGTSAAAVFDFVLPRGEPGPAVGPGSIGAPELAASAFADQPTVEAGADQAHVVNPLGVRQAIAVRATAQVSNYAAMIALDPAKTKAAVVYGAGGRNGTFVWSGSNLSAEVTLDTLQGVYVAPASAPTGASGAWVRLFTGPASVLWFGAVGDGTTDDSAAFQCAVDLAKDVYAPYRSAGYVVSGVTLAIGVRITGERGRYGGADNPTYGAQMTTLLAKTGASYIFRVTTFSLGTPVEVSDLRFDGGATTATAIRMGTSSAPVMGVRLRRLSFYRCYEAIGDEVHATNIVLEFMAEDIQCNVPRNRQIYIRRSGGLLRFADVKIDYTNNIGDITWEGIRLVGVAGVELERVDIIGHGTGATYQAAAFGIIIAAADGLGASVWMNRITCDTLNGPGIYMENILHFQMDQVMVGHCYGQPVYLGGCSYGTVNGLFIFGTRVIGGGPASNTGLFMTGCTDSQLFGVNIKDCTGAGALVSNSLRIKINGGSIKDNVGNGLQEAGTSTANLYSGLTITGNAQSLIQVGGNSASVNWVPNSGIYTASTVGAATIA